MTSSHQDPSGVPGHGPGGAWGAPANPYGTSRARAGRATSSGSVSGRVTGLLRGLGLRTGSIVMVAVIGIVGCADLVMSPFWASTAGGDEAETFGEALLVLAVILFTLLHGLLLVRRETHPGITVIVTSAAAMLLPVSPAAALVALSSGIAHDRLRLPWHAGALVTIAVVVVTARDLLGTTAATSTLRSLTVSTDHPPDAYVPMPLVPAVLLCVLSVAGAVGLGLLRRWRAAARSARSAVAGAERERDDAVSTVSRQAEREQVAREIHDGIGHRLSLLALDAAALQVAAGDDPELKGSAGRVRSQAAAATQDLRTLVGMLREGTPEPVVTLDQLQQVLDDAADAGQPLSATVSITDGARAPAQLSRAAHRIVTELMTNARKHAAGHTLRLRVTGAPRDGVHILASNPVPPGSVPSRGGGRSGLTGIAERAALLGGLMTTDVTDAGRFEVEVFLPWDAGSGVGPAP